jgi:hypothetical protein
VALAFALALVAPWGVLLVFLKPVVSSVIGALAAFDP